MTESEFIDLIESDFSKLEYALDEVDAELDYELSGGVLTLQFENGSSIIFSRQRPTRQLWLAARSGGFHFEYDESVQDWRDTRSGELFRPFVVALMKSQGAVDFVWLEA